ncbi:uncharacterized protein LOC127867583 [Dreissena polymorpha]|uniref:B box-type domain-containing protein n=1 Tax=Dreissena polymorpha TaxID=45954 RepID=A0A9D4NGX4_DREPO|nr:uncharacterized protein LOC127867583 [Dreissena polymorpha]KAH3892992.1 hypothetical protein DPMN_017129 [Dreissena polymorpha]
MTDTSSDVIYDYCCNACEEDNANREAMFYCQPCSKRYCDKCIEQHNVLFKKHKSFGRKELDKWPAAKTAMDLLQNCQQHPYHRIELFCEDHMTLCCVLCHLYDHKQCNKITQTAEKAKTMNQSDFQRLATTLVSEQQILGKEIDMANECLQTLHEARDRAHKEIQLFRKTFNDLLDHLEGNTVQTLDTLHNTLGNVIKSGIWKCSKLKEDFKSMQEAIKDVDCGKPNVQIFIAHSKITEMVSNRHTLLKKISANRNVDMTFQGNPDVGQYLSGLSVVGNVEGSNRVSGKCLSGEIAKCKEVMIRSVKLVSDKNTCDIRSIIELPSGEVLMTDWNNKRMKLIDMQYKVVAHTDLPNSPCDICSISSTEFAVTYYTASMIQFLTVNNSQIVVGRTLKFEHDCIGIAYYKGTVFVTSSTALYQYRLDGQLVKKIYEDNSVADAVYKCAVSGSLLYVTSFKHDKLLTMSMDGTILISFKDPALRGLSAVHMSESGLLLVCGYDSHNLVLVYGVRGLLTLASEKDGLFHPESVFYSERSDRLIVGNKSDNILVIRTTVSEHYKTFVRERGADRLGFSIVGGHGSPIGDLPIYVANITKGTEAENGQLKRGDQILSVNGASLEGLTHDEAVNILKNAKGSVIMNVLSYQLQLV